MLHAMIKFTTLTNVSESKTILHQLLFTTVPFILRKEEVFLRKQEVLNSTRQTTLDTWILCFPCAAVCKDVN